MSDLYKDYRFSRESPRRARPPAFLSEAEELRRLKNEPRFLWRLSYEDTPGPTVNAPGLDVRTREDKNRERYEKFRRLLKDLQTRAGPWGMSPSTESRAVMHDPKGRGELAIESPHLTDPDPPGNPVDLPPMDFREKNVRVQPLLSPEEAMTLFNILRQRQKESEYWRRAMPPGGQIGGEL